MRRLSFKAGVRVERWTAELCILVNAALQAQDDLGFPQEVHVTSINDGRHSTNPRSRHYSDEAIDIRTKGTAGTMRHDMVSLHNKKVFREHMEQCAGLRFRVLLEDVGTNNEHIHAQVKRGQRYP